MDEILLTISICAHNSLENTRRCMESLIKHTVGVKYKVIFTDNASSDDTVKYIKSLREGCEIDLVENDKNLGFIGPQNAAFEKCRSKYFLVLNNDVTVCKDWVRKMLGEFENDPKVVSCGVKNTCIALNDAGVGVPGHLPEYVEGSCMLVDAEAIRNLPGGLFDPVYRFGYFEDSDLGLRIRRAGHKLAVVDIPVIHIGGATSRVVKNVDLEGYKIRNRHIFMSRWGDYLKERSVKPISTDRIVVRRGGAHGDVILATPILRALRTMYPMSQIHVQTTCVNVLQGNPDITSAALMIPKKDGDYLIDLDMAYEKTPNKHIVKAYAEIAGVELPDPEDWRPRLYPTDSARTVARQRMPAGKKYAVIHPGLIGGWVGRQWPINRFHEVSKALGAAGYTTVLVGATTTPQIGTHMDFRNLPLTHFAALMELASLFVGLDSMPFHVAQAFKIPSVVIFGSIEPSLRIIPGWPVIPVTADGVACLGCHHWLPAPRTCTNQCLRGTNACMENIGAEKVIAAISKLEQFSPSAVQSGV